MCARSAQHWTINGEHIAGAGIDLYAQVPTADIPVGPDLPFPNSRVTDTGASQEDHVRLPPVN